MKTEFKELITQGDFIVNSKVFDLGRQAEIIATIAQEKIDEDGEHAKIHASNVIKWMQDIAGQAQKVLDLKLKEDNA